MILVVRIVQYTVELDFIDFGDGTNVAGDQLVDLDVFLAEQSIEVTDFERALGIANEKPLYVIQIERAKNQIIVGEDNELDSKEFTAKGVNWVAFDEPSEPVRAEVKVRYRHEPAPATIYALYDNGARIVFDEPQRAITPGQATIFYNGDEVVGGGWIIKS